MALSANARAFAWGDGVTVAAQDLRLSAAGAMLSGLGAGSSVPLAVGSGVRDATGNPLQAIVSAALSVTVNTGYCAIQGSASANAGAYMVTLDTVATLTCTAADTVHARIDSVCMTVTDVGTSSSTAVVQIVTGTPASSPSAPSLPANSLLLCNITVAANATTLSSGNLSDQRQFLAAAGGIKRYLNASQWPTSGTSSMYVHDDMSGRLKRFNSALGTVTAPGVAAFTPAQAGPATVSASGTYVTIASTPVTVDGFTNVKCALTWDFISSSGTVAGNACNLTCFRSATNVGNVVKYVNATNGNADGGTALIIDDTPAAGTYTYSWAVVNHGTGTFTVNIGTVYTEAQSP